VSGGASHGAGAEGRPRAGGGGAPPAPAAPHAACVSSKAIASGPGAGPRWQERLQRHARAHYADAPPADATQGALPRLAQPAPSACHLWAPFARPSRPPTGPTLLQRAAPPSPQRCSSAAATSRWWRSRRANWSRLRRRPATRGGGFGGAGTAPHKAVRGTGLCWAGAALGAERCGA
jgi:hypothetical protein